MKEADVSVSFQIFFDLFGAMYGGVIQYDDNLLIRRLLPQLSQKPDKLSAVREF